MPLRGTQPSHPRLYCRERERERERKRERERERERERKREEEVIKPTDSGH